MFFKKRESNTSNISESTTEQQHLQQMRAQMLGILEENTAGASEYATTLATAKENVNKIVSPLNCF